jgi:cold shock CspA family protein/ribosome-associated translation inhibitor RaiA
MQTAPRISFHGFTASPTLKALIDEQIEQLERYHPRLVSCHVTVEVPHRRHRKGNVWHVKLDVSVPGKDVFVTREAEKGRRHEVPEAAVRDAFQHARRQLKSQRTRQVGEVKVHEGQPTARVDALNGDHGFLTTDDGRSIYFHANSVLGGGFDKLKRGTPVAFVEEDGVEGPQASTLRPIPPSVTARGARRAS